MDDEASNDGRETIEVSLVLQKEVYELIKRISNKLGMEPSSWINLVLSSKLKDMGPEVKDKKI